MLFSQFGINYNTVPDMYKKGSLIVWTSVEHESGEPDGDSVPAQGNEASVAHYEGRPVKSKQKQKH